MNTPRPGLPLAPHSVSQAVEALDAFAALLQCADAELWRSHARPQARGLAAIAFAIHAELCDGISEVFSLADQLHRAA